MRIASWNINSIRAHMNRLLGFLERHNPDIVCLQETKISDRDFPTMQLGAAGYYSMPYGQPGYNGVAILIRGITKQRGLGSFSDSAMRKSDHTKKEYEITEISRGFAEDPAENERRVLSACMGGIRLVNAYVINGEDKKSNKFELKKEWVSRLGGWLQSFTNDPPILIVGDFNIAPGNLDVWDPIKTKDRIHCTTEERTWLKDFQGERLLDLFRTVNPGSKEYTWWPYTKGGFENNEGLRIDLALGDKSLISSIKNIWVDKEEREPNQKLGIPSDHAPLIIDFNLA